MKRASLMTTVLIVCAPALAWAQEAPAGASSKAFMEAHQKMMAGMPLKPSVNPDRDFAGMMIPHHQGAIDMAKIELQYGKDPELRAMAAKMIAAQEGEVAELKKWLDEGK